MAILGFLNNRKNGGGRVQLNAKKEHVPLKVDFIIEASTLEKLKAFSDAASLPLGEAAMLAIEKGMTNYRLMFYISLKQEYASLMENYEKFMSDNELLVALEKQNEDLQARLCSKNRSTDAQKG